MKTLDSMTVEQIEEMKLWLLTKEDLRGIIEAQKLIICSERELRRKAEASLAVVEETGINSVIEPHLKPICVECARTGYGSLHINRIKQDGEECCCVHHSARRLDPRDLEKEGRVISKYRSKT